MTGSNLITPDLTYRGTVDVSTASNGSTLYLLRFDESMCTGGNQVLMIEYKYYKSDGSIDPNFGYVDMDTTSNCGIANQYNVCVPVPLTTYGYNSNVKIEMSIYYGINSNLADTKI